MDKSLNTGKKFSIIGSSIIYLHREKSLTQESEERENVGLVRFELTIDGSLRHASVLQRVIIFLSADPLFIICEHKERKDRWSPSPFRARPQPRVIRVQDFPATDSINSQYTNLRVWLPAFFFSGSLLSVPAVRPNGIFRKNNGVFLLTVQKLPVGSLCSAPLFFRTAPLPV